MVGSVKQCKRVALDETACKLLRQMPQPGSVTGIDCGFQPVAWRWGLR
jgi:hypothetical protein